MEESIDIPDLEQIEDLETAKSLFGHMCRALESQARMIEELRHENAELKRALFGQKSERVVPVDREIAAKNKEDETPQEAAERKKKTKRKRNRRREERRDAAPTEVVVHPIEDEHCPQCGLPAEEAAEVSDEVSEEYEYRPAQLVRREHHRKRAVCACGCFLTAGPVPRVVEGGLYGPGLHAHVAVSKCADSLPLDRLRRRFRRSGVPVSRSTLCDIFHRTAELVAPLSRRIVEIVAAARHVNADETSIKVQQTGECRRAYVWTFIARTEDDEHTMIGYRFSPDRSGETPADVLGDTTGVLQVDGYTGYNHVTRPKRRDRAGCWGHARRKFFQARATSLELADHAIDLIRQIYEVEYEAADLGIVGTERHRALRKTKSKALVDELFGWVEQIRPGVRPKSPLGVALRYLSNQRKTLERFIDDPKIRLDNNIAEQHLRLIALGRKNFLFVGHDDAGRNLAILQTLVSTCIANAINPQDYLADVLMRVGEHPHSAIDELLPWNWTPPP